MYLHVREALAESLRKSGYRVISPMKVPLGWVDIAIRGKSIGIEIFAGCYESCVERLSSYPFRKVYVVGDCEGCESLDAFCELFGLQIPKIDESPPEHESSMTAKAVMDALAYLYIAQEVYEGCIDFKPLQLVLPDLKKYGLATSSSRPKFKPKFFVSLSRDGYRAAKKILAERITLFEKKLRKLASPLAYVIALGISHELKLRENPSPEGYSLQALLSYMNSAQVETMISRREHPKVMLCEFLVKSALNREAVKLAEELCKMGLAVKIKSYSPFGDEMGEEYRFAREAVETLLKFSYAEFSSDVLAEFLAAAYPLISSDVYPILKFCREKLIRAEKLGVCRLDGVKLVKSEKFDDYAKVRLAMVVEKVIEALSL